MNVVISQNDLKFYTHITVPAYGEANGTMMEQDCFLLNKKIFPAASAEISELRFFSLQEYLSESNKAPGALMVLKKLKDDCLID